MANKCDNDNGEGEADGRGELSGALLGVHDGSARSDEGPQMVGQEASMLDAHARGNLGTLYPKSRP